MPSAPTLFLDLYDEGQGVVSPSKISAVWLRPENDGGAAITGYRLEYKGGSIASWTHWPDYNSTPSGKTHWTDITGLSPSYTYEARVRATNSAGDGPWSAVKSVTIPGDPPPVPGKPTLEVDYDIHSHHGKILMSWIRPSNADALSHFEVQYKGGSTTSWTDSSDAIEQKGALWVTTLTGLDDGTEYELGVRALNIDDVAGEWSDVKTGETRAALQKLVVRTKAEEKSSGLDTDLIPYSRHVNRGKIEVRWLNRNSPRFCVTYEVQYKCGSITDWRDQPVSIYDQTQGEVWITGLPDGTWYDIRVRPVTYDSAHC